MLEALAENRGVPEAVCEFCDEFAGGLTNSFYARYRGSPKTRFLLSTKNFHVFPSIGQLVEGYLLIAPLVHYTMMGKMPGQLVMEMVEISTCVSAALSRAFGPCVFFEHGAGAPLNGGCGIYHAHLHAMPLASAFDPINILKQRFPYTELEDPSRMAEQSLGLACYLFYQDANARCYLFDTGPLPSQYMRKLLADLLGIQDWNWRTAGREERLLATLEKFSGRFDVIAYPARQP